MSEKGAVRRAAPAPGEAPLVVSNAAALLIRNGTDPAIRDRVAVRFDDLAWTHRDYLGECRRWATVFDGWRPTDPATPFHVGVLLDNTPAYLAALGAAALTGAAVVGLNPTRQGAALLRDIEHTDLCAIVTEPRHRAALDVLPEAAPPVLTTARWDGGGSDLDERLDAAAPYDGPEPDLATTWCLVFTSGTVSAPKAVICSQRRMLVTGERMRIILDVGPDDVGYLSMPLFHSNSLMVGLLPALIAGASVALARRFTASGWLDDVRRYGVTYWNYTGKPLTYVLGTPEQTDDADNPLRRAYGNEGSDRIVAAFARRFGAEIIDAFGPTEGGIGIARGADDPPGALGHSADNVRVVDDAGNPLPRASFDEHGRLTNAEVCVGEIVNTAGPGPFEGYWRNDEAAARATRNGWYWTGDLGYVDDAGYVYFAGRTADWMRVDGENFPAGPVETAVARHPDVLVAAVYAVPDPDAGDAVMAAIVLRDGGDFDPAAFAHWLDVQPDLGPKWRPRWVRVTAALPMTASNKVVHRQLQQEKFRSDRVGGDPIWWRPRDAAAFKPYTPADEHELQAAFQAAGRERFWDL